MSDELLNLITVPLFTGAIGYTTNWSGVWMLFNPVYFKGFRVPGLKAIVEFLPRKIQQIPGVMHGGVGWQGIIPSRAAKMGSISVDKGIAKLGSPSEFYKQLEPDKIAEHILDTARDDMREMVERIMQREHPDMWNDLPQRARERVHARVQEQLPDIVREVTDAIGTHTDQILDIKLMVIRYFEENPEMANRIFEEIGHKELRFITNFGFYFGFLLGIPVAFATNAIHYWWLLPLLGIFVGYITNLIAIYMIFQPVEERRFFGLKLQGLFIKRQDEVSEVYAKIVADDIVNLNNIGEELLSGPRSDRTRKLIETAMRPALDRAIGPLRSAVRVAIGGRQYDAIRESVATEAVDYTMTPLGDPAFNERQSTAIRKLITDRMREMAPKDFSEMLRTAMREDEWLLYLHGAVLGLGAGLLHLLIFPPPS
ncbi:MAG: hypothetical protein M3Y34_08130 [Actinomycetota bacterium]|nr:hypothetical protein [Actinomycetota bacterium]